MTNEKLIVPCLYLQKGQAVAGRKDSAIFASGNAAALARSYGDQGADMLLVLDLSSGDAEHEEAIGAIKKICASAEIPVIGAGNIRRMEDVKKLLYAGCAKVLLNFSRTDNRDILREVSERFGKEKILAGIWEAAQLEQNREIIAEYASGVFTTESQKDAVISLSPHPVILHMEQEDADCAVNCLRQADGISGAYVSRHGAELMEFKISCREQGIPVKVYESRIPWSDFKLNSDGMIPVIVQDYKTDEVLMLAYMNEEAYHTTLRTGKMTYWSRSRDELWVKGLTSGHFQYVKSLTLDCDNDTILAKVDQIGAACHTGSRSCFFNELMKKDYDDTNPLRVFQDVYDVILDRRIHPREGSYTNYLFDKGLDKILKKVGEECTEIVIAAKNPDKEEIKYEISDFLYHAMVLMVEKGVTWEEITRELARR